MGVGYTVAEFPDTPSSSSIYPSYYHMLFKTNNQGDSIFIKNPDFGNQNFFNQYGFYAGNVLYSFVKISENSFMAAGYTQTVLPTQSSFDSDCIFFKFDSNGDSLSCSAISVADSQIAALNIILSSDYYLMAVGYEITLSANVGRGVVIKADTMGNVIWRKTYTTPFDMHISGIAESPGGGFILAAQAYNGEWFNTNQYSPVMLKIDTAGNIVWTKFFPSIDYVFLLGPSVTKTSDNNYIFSYPDYAQAPKHFKMNGNGDTLWTRSINIYQQDGYATQSTFSASDNYGGIVAIATVSDSAHSYLGAIYRLSGDGDLLWHRKFGNTFGRVVAYSVKQTQDSGFVVTGGSWCCNHIWPNGASISSLYVIKFDSLGLLYPPPTGMPELEQTKISNPYPNPASTQTTFNVLVPPTNNSGMGEKGAFLYVFDIRGAQVQKHILQTGLNTLTLNVSSLAAGEYLCVLALDGYNAGGRRFVVSR